jgi:hypothetical protein
LYCSSIFHSCSRVFNNEYKSYSKTSVVELYSLFLSITAVCCHLCLYSCINFIGWSNLTNTVITW